jgi:hypothetical protein
LIEIEVHDNVCLGWGRLIERVAHAAHTIRVDRDALLFGFRDCSGQDQNQPAGMFGSTNYRLDRAGQRDLNLNFACRLVRNSYMT